MSARISAGIHCSAPGTAGPAGKVVTIEASQTIVKCLERNVAMMNGSASLRSRRELVKIDVEGAEREVIEVWPPF